MSAQLRRYTSADKVTVEQFEVTSAQAAFVEPLRETLSMEMGRDNFVIEANGEPVGFFQIDHASATQCVEDHLELHEVSIDWRHQGKKYGKAFVEALPLLLNTEYPDWRGVCLTVNCRNEKAKRLYEYGGFTDTGELKLDGPSGPQHIMRRAI
ncbi:MAG: GNAT family N-acetyltransferase [Rhodospirillaceae bacterium]|nr:GNAT family N-acetyltransferase [Rhodospirillaceae bacterium]|tara:strand:+ start:175 stop:633 length:459 start_codon:yes stop_codon:yes gene_type:complete